MNMLRIAKTVFLLIACYFGMVVQSVAHEAGDAVKPACGDRPFLVLKALPSEASSYRSRAGELVRAGIPERFGHEEWAAVVLTNEVHQHVGIYTILGAKMGVRAREILEAPTRAVNVIVETGSLPPMSCAVDGLQVSLGSTLAQDLIHVRSVAHPQVAGVFEYKGHRVRLSLKPEFQKHVDDTISAAVKECGDLTPAYFERVEVASYRVWAEFDRSAIFVEEELKP